MSFRNLLFYVYSGLCTVYFVACTSIVDADRGNPTHATDVQSTDSVLGTIPARLSSANTSIPADIDGDSFDSTVDCDDYDDNTYPGAFELCDLRDNDCDGLIDETWKTYSNSAYGKKCYVTGDDGCPNEGIWLCGFDRASLSCTAQPTTQHFERCNGVDDDCNGLIDDAWPYLHTACEAIIGSCTLAGIWECDPYDEQPYCATQNMTEDCGL